MLGMLCLSATAARALTPMDYAKYDGSKPVISMEEFKEFFREGDHYMIDPKTDRPMTESDIKGFWNDMLKTKPELKPYLEGNWNMLPRHMRGMSEKAIADVESTLHSVMALHTVPNLSISELPKEGRRLAKVLAEMGPDRLQKAVGSISGMDYYELEAVMQAVGSSIDELRPMLNDQAFIRQALDRIPEAGVTLKNFGGPEGVVRILHNLHLPREDSEKSNDPLLKTASVSGTGGMLGMAAPALSVMQGLVPDPSIEPPVNKKKPADDPGFEDPNKFGPAAQNPPDTDPLQGSITAPSTGDDESTLQPEPRLGNAAGPQPSEAVEKPSSDDLMPAQAAQCPLPSNTGVTRNDNACLNVDSSETDDFDKFDETMKDVNGVIGKIGDLGSVAANVGLMSDAAAGASAIVSGNLDQAISSIRASKADVDNFKSLGADLNAMAAEATDPVEISAIEDLMQQHRILSTGMTRSVSEVEMLDDPKVKSAINQLSGYNIQLNGMRNAVGALASIPNNLDGSADKVKSLISSVTGTCTGGMLGDVLSTLESAGENGLSKDDITDSLSGMLGMNGFTGLVQLFIKIYEAAKTIRKIVVFAQTVRSAVSALQSLKQLIDMAQKMDDAKSAASGMAETSNALENAKALNSASGKNLDLSSLNGAMDVMDKLKKATRAKNDGKDLTGKDNQAPPPTREQFQHFFDSMGRMQTVIAQGHGAAIACLQNLATCPPSVLPIPPAMRTLMDKAEAMKGPLNTAIGAMRALDGAVAPSVNISVNFNPAALFNFQKVAGQIPALITKVNAVPKLRDKMDKLVEKFAGLFTVADDLRKQMCLRAPNYSIYYCIPPIVWPISQSNLYAMINSFTRDNRYTNFRPIGMIPGDISAAERLGTPLLQASYQLQTAVLGFGFNFEPVTAGVSGSVPEKTLVRMTTPRVSPLNLNEGWLERSTCPRTPATYGWLTDEVDELREDTDTAPRDESTDFKLPQDVRQNILTTILIPTIKNAITCSPIRPAKAGCSYHGCNPPFFTRLMLDSCTNQYITSQSLYPTYIADTQSRPSMTPTNCQPLSLIPPNDCMKDANGKCMVDEYRCKHPSDWDSSTGKCKLDSKGKSTGIVRHEYDAWRYLERAWYGTMVNNYFPAIYFPTINHWDESYMDEYNAEFAKYLANPNDTTITKYIHNPNAQIVAPGIDHYYEDETGKYLPQPRGVLNFRERNFRPQIADLITNPYESIKDVTHPFTPRWDFETNDRDKYDVCVSMSLNNKPDYCGSKNFWWIPGMNGIPVWGQPVNCAATPVDILRFREKRFDNCIMCRITTNRDCLWSEVKGVPIISIIIEVIRAVLYYIAKAACWGITVCGDIVVGIMDIIFFDPMGHNEAKNLWMVAKKSSDKDCKARNSKNKCRSIIDPIRALILLLKEGKRGSDGSFSGHPYDTMWFRFLTGTLDPFEDGQVDMNQIREIFQSFDTYDFSEAYSQFKSEYRSLWKDALRPMAKKICGSWFGGKFPQLCFPARYVLRKGFKAVFEKGKDSSMGQGVAKIGTVSFCKSDRTKQGRNKFPPCSTSGSMPDRDKDFCKDTCKVSIKDCCNEINKPLAPINLLRLAPYTKAERDRNMFAEGTTFEEYFGDHRPYMRLWDTGTEWGAINGKNIDLNSDLGARVRVVGVGTAERSCRIGGWGYLGKEDPTAKSLDPALDKTNNIHNDPFHPLDNGKTRFKGDACVHLPNDNTVHPLTSWTELKLYQARTYRNTGLNCIGQFEKLHKVNMMEDVVLKMAGGSVLLNNGVKDHTVTWPLSHRGFLWDPKMDDKQIANIPDSNSKIYRWDIPSDTRFPNFAKRPGASATVLRGLDNAQPGDIVYLDPSDYNVAYPDRVTRQPIGDGKAIDNFKMAADEYVPFIGYVAETFNDSSYLAANPAEPGEQPNAAGRDRYWVHVLQTNAGQYPDSCGITELAGNARHRTIYRHAAQLEDPNNAKPAARLTALKRLQSCIGAGGANCNFPDSETNALVQQSVQNHTSFAVYNTRCQADPMLRECSFEDPRVTAKGLDLWNMVRIYRPYGDDYRGGCMVRPNAAANNNQRVDIANVSPNEMHLVPEKDVMDCLSAGYDTPPASRNTMKNAEKYDVVADVRGPGYETTSLGSQISHLPLSVLARLRPDPQVARLLTMFPGMANKPYIGFVGVPRSKSSQLLSLTVDVNIGVNFDPVHSGSTIKPGFNALGALYSFEGLRDNPTLDDLMRAPDNLAGMSARGQLDTLYAGGAAALGTQLSQVATSGFNPKDGLPRPIISQRTTGPQAVVVGDVELHMPPTLNRTPPNGRDIQPDAAQSVPDIAISKYPGFAIRGLLNDVANIIFPPCYDVGKTCMDNAVKVKDGKVTLTNHLVGDDDLKAKYEQGLSSERPIFDSDVLVLTPPDTLLQVPAGKERILTFPYGVSFRSQCKEPIKFDSYARIKITADDKLFVIKGEKKADPMHYLLHKDQKKDQDGNVTGEYYTFTPVEGYVPSAGDVLPIDISKQLIPAINVLPDQNLDAKPTPGKEEKPDVPSQPYDGMDQYRKAYDKDSMPGSRQEEVDKLMDDVNDVCSGQDDHQCPDKSIVPDGSTRDKLYKGAGIDPENPGLTQQPLTCIVDSGSNECIRDQLGPCGLDPNSDSCKDDKDFCASQPKEPHCDAAEVCKGDFSKPQEVYQKCITTELDRCTLDPSGEGCNAEAEYCKTNPTKEMCNPTGGGSESFCKDNPKSPVCSSSGNDDKTTSYCVKHPDDKACKLKGG